MLNNIIVILISHLSISSVINKQLITIINIFLLQHKMAPSKNNKSRDEILQKKREQEKARLLKIKSDPVKLAEQRAKERLKCFKKRKRSKKKY